MDISLAFFFFSLKVTNTLCHGQYEYSYRELGPNMNIHITWLTYVRTGPKKKNRIPDARPSDRWKTEKNGAS